MEQSNSVFANPSPTQQVHSVSPTNTSTTTTATTQTPSSSSPTQQQQQSNQTTTNDEIPRLADTFATSSAERQKRLQSRKEQLLEIARNQYLKKQNESQQ